MSLYGALFGAVSGLNAQSSQIGAISDNIANSNTIGYKQATAVFQSLVINSSSTGTYQTGGVRSGTQLNVDQQGLLQSTNSPTDLAIQGNGFFVVRSQPAATATPVYTRAGSFTQDALGNFINSSGYYLQGWPLDRNGLLPGEPGNLNTTSFTNFDSLQTVNVQSASGTATSTSTVSIGANLNAGETVFPGSSQAFAPDSNVTNNQNLAAEAVIIGSEYGLSGAAGDGIARGDAFTVKTGTGQQYTYQYGGYTVGRDVGDADANANVGDGGTDNKTLVALAGADVVASAGGVYTVNVPNHDLITGDSITLAGLPAKGSTPAAELNTTHTITWVDANHVSFTVATDAGAGNYSALASGGTADIRHFQGNILDATGDTSLFLGSTGTAGYSASSLTFSITSPAIGTKTFTYTSGTPNTANGEFDNMNTLASAIDQVDGMTARVVNGRLVVAADDATQSVTFKNNDATGDTVGGTTRGIDWVGELGLANVTSSGGTARFASLQGLAALVNSSTGISATINNPLASSSLKINVDDPLSTIQFFDQPPAQDISGAGALTINTNGAVAAGGTYSITINKVPDASMKAGDKVYLSGTAGVAGTGLVSIQPDGGPYTVASITGTSYTLTIPTSRAETLVAGSYALPAGAMASLSGVTNQGSLLASMGAISSLDGTAYNDPLVAIPFTASNPAQTAKLGPEYDPSGSVGKNMASGDITAQFSRNVEVFDGLGTGHNIRFSFLKVGNNTWQVEVHAIPASDVSAASGLVDGQIAVGQIKFNGDGTLQQVDQTLTKPLSINWTNGSTASTISLNLGTAGSIFGTAGATTIGQANGLSQFDSAYNVNFANQNGAPVGQLVSVAVDNQGVVVASYSNGQTQKLFQLPLAEFANPDGLQAVSGNVFNQTRDSGEVNLRQAGTNGTGTVVASTLEQSNVDLATQLTDMIVAQRAYQANTQVIKIADQLLDQLNQI